MNLYEVWYTKFNLKGITRHVEVLRKEALVAMLNDPDVLVKKVKLTR